MKPSFPFLMAGGGTGGHVIPALAVARQLRRRGHQPFFVGTRRGLEARLVPPEDFPIDWIEIGGLKSVGRMQTARTLWQLPLASWRCLRIIATRQPRAVFSMGGYVAGPVMLAACWKRIPVVLMEPNAMPGFTSRRMARFVARALLNFEEAARYFPKGRTLITGLPVRSEFFALAPKPRTRTLNVLITGGSQGSRTLNLAARQSWPLFRQAGFPVSLLHQTGPAMFTQLEAEFAASGLEGRIVPFIQDMPAAFAAADLVVCRSGAGAVAELAAAGKPSILVPFPFAADDHQLRNAQAFEQAGAARLLLDRDAGGESLFREIASLASGPGLLESMGEAARRLAHPGAAEIAADILEDLAAISH
jgi:UDP-N-acetylglucosamine--N-acetylmuramyl-(pentapeptide) pyrophosphoryl-undecaprenol N-acetylglucosamine transferase